MIMLCITIGYGQKYADYNRALAISNDAKYTINTLSDAGKETQEVPTSSCLKDINFEKHSAWLRCKVKQAGSIAFDIIPLRSSDDLDFIVFYLPDNNFEHKKEIRCMAAGISMGDINASGSCQGVTGLSTFSDDTKESEGCSKDKDNFLAPIEAKEGEEYLILVNNVSSTEGFTLAFNGTAILENPNENNFMVSDFAPNPATDLIRTTINSPTAQNINMVIYDLAGRQLTSIEKSLAKGLNSVSIPISSYSSGTYQVRISSTSEAITKSFIKL